MKEFNTPFYEWGRQYVNTLDLSDQHNILEIGCRRGLISYHLAKKYPASKILALDNIVAEIEYARQFHSSNLQFEVMDLLHLEYVDYFDVIVSFNTLLWIKEKPKVLKNLFCALKPGKKLLMQVFVLTDRPKNDRGSGSRPGYFFLFLL
jgi:trans-aconitate methyltransferase